MKQHHPIILASASPRRKELLEKMGLTIVVQPSEIEEVGYGGAPGMIPSQITQQKMKVAKSSFVSATPKGSKEHQLFFIAADTIVALGNEVFGKPENIEQARTMLSQLSGKEHQVYTCFRIEDLDGHFIEKTICTNVKMRTITKEILAWYLETKEPFDKAGSYAIQGFGSVLVESIQGSYTNVVGLPVAEVVDALMELKVISF